MIYKPEVDRLLPGEIYQLVEGTDTLDVCDKQRVVIILARKRNVTEHEAIELLKKADFDNPIEMDGEYFSYEE